MEGYSQKQVDGANKAMRLYHLLRVPQIDDAKMVLRQNLIKDCRVTNEEMNDAKAIYSKSSVSKSKDLTTKKKPGKVVEDFIEIPPELYLRNSQVVLAIDVFYVNQCAFLSTIDTSVRYRTAVPIDNETDEAYFDALNDVARIYNGADFKIRMIRCDGAFESIMEQVQDEMDIEMDYCPPNGHVPEAERNNRSIQDRTRAGFYRLPYPVIPKLMIQYLVMTCAGSFNWVPPKGGISKFYSPYMIMSHQGLDMNKHFQYELGAYVQVYAETQPTNTNRPRTLDCIYLSPDWNNLNGGHRVMDLNTGKEIRRHKIVCELPITELFINRVAQMAEKQGIKKLKFLDRKRNEIIFPDADLGGVVDYQLKYNDDAADPNYRYKEERDVRFAADDDIDDTELADLAADTADLAAEPAESEDNEDPVEIDEAAAEAADEALDEEISSGIMDMDTTPIEEEVVFEETEDPVVETVDNDDDDDDDSEESNEPAADVEIAGVRRSSRARSAPVRLDPIPTKKSYLQSAVADIEDHQMKGDKIVTFRNATVEEARVRTESCYNIHTQAISKDKKVHCQQWSLLRLYMR